MQIDQFISESLKGIIKGVKDVQEFAFQHGARVNPYVTPSDKGKTLITFYGEEEGMRAVSTIEFDIAVTTSSESEVGGQGGINVLSLKAGGKMTDKDLSQTVSRIKFSINVALPNVAP